MAVRNSPKAGYTRQVPDSYAAIAAAAKAEPAPKPSKTCGLRWDELPSFPRAHYTVDVEWGYLEQQIERSQEYGLDLDPDYQRVHVWTPEQRRKYLEYVLQGGEVGRTLTFVCTDWNKTPVPGYSLLDGKQRLETVRMFMRDEVAVFPGFRRPEGWKRSEVGGSLRLVQASFKWQVVQTPTRADVLQLYLSINAGGTPHSEEELERVRRMLAEETRCSTT